MTIEIRELQIKSSVTQDAGTKKQGNDAYHDLEEIKEDILLECRRMIIEMLDQKEER